jgi:sialate O-acetylesterase
LNLREWLEDPPEERVPVHPFAPGFLWEAGVRRILPFPVRGILWYQGESNATIDGGSGPAVSREINREKFESLIRSWREGWGDEELPFYFVQLPGLNRDWEEFREMQREVSRRIPGTGMVVTLDAGHPTDVHPRNKRPVGERLAGLALRETYNRKDVLVSPDLRGVEYQGERVVLTFDREVSSKEPVVGFETAGEDGVFQKAKAVVAGRQVVVEDALGREVKGVRYAWADHPVAALTGPEGLPVGPFWEQERNEKDPR